MALYQNGILISGANALPQMTLAEYQALPVSERPTYWERTDLNYNNIPASNVTYGSGSVEDALDGLGTWATQTVSMTGFLTGTATLYINEKTRQCVFASTSVETVASSQNNFWAIVARIPSAYIPKYGVVGTLDLTSSDGALFNASIPIHKNNVNDIVASCVPLSISAGLIADFSVSWVY